MADTDFVHGEMDISSQKATWDGFLKGGIWGGFLIFLVLAHLTLTIAIGLHWLISLVILAGVGIVGGLALGMGGAWIAAVVALSGLAIIVQIVIAFAKMAL